MARLDVGGHLLGFMGLLTKPRTALLVVVLLALTNSISAQFWTTASLSVPRAYPAAASVGDVALFGGGWNGTDASTAVAHFAAVDIFDVTSGTWTTATLSVARWALAATSVGDVALFGGGGQNVYGAASAAVDLYNAKSGTWATATLSVARWALAASSVGDVALFAGGWDTTGDGDGDSDDHDAGHNSTAVDIYHATSGTWTTATLSVPRWFLAATSVGGVALFGGGWNGTHVSAAVDIYHATSGTWTTATLSVARDYLAATSVGDVALFGGGQNATGYASATVDIYHATSGTWTTATLSMARWYLAATSVGDVALFGGGAINASNDASAAVDIYHDITPSSSSSLCLPLPIILTATITLGLVIMISSHISMGQYTQCY